MPTTATSPPPPKRRRTASLEADLLTPPLLDEEDPLSSRSLVVPQSDDDDDVDDDEDLFSHAAHVLATEAAALASITALYRTSSTAKKNLKSAVETILHSQQSRGKLIVSGVGKSAYIAQKLVATCKSMGVATSFMHACEAETSMMLALRPDSVRRERLEEAHGPASTRVEGQPPTLALRRSFRDISPSGVVGDARPASAEKGEKLLDKAAERIAAMLGNAALWG